MFVRVKKHPGSKRCSVLICETVREEKTVSQQIIKHLGISDDPEKIDAMKAQGQQFIEELKFARANPTIPKQTLSLNTREVTRKNVGIRDVLGTLYDELGFNTILGSKKLCKTLKSVVLTRFAEPSSKRKTSLILERKFNETLPLDSIYYMMDQLVENLDTSQRIVFQATKLAVGNTVDLALFDVTTLHLETVVQDELRNFGYSKNNRMDSTQVTLALATTSDGLPIGYRLFPGNTAEVNTLMASINQWKENISINKIIIVGDRAMMSKDNIAKLQQSKLGYIIAYPLKKSTASLKDKILNKSTYTNTTTTKETYLKQEIELENNQRLIVTFSEKRRQKDEKDRNKLISKLEKKLSTTKDAKKLITNRGYLKFTDISNKTQAEINQEKVAEDAKWDGLHGVVTNTHLSAEEVIDKYKNLWVIEEAFRINKHNLKMRPIYHYTPNRIKAHIEICFLTFALVKHALRVLKNAGQKMSTSELREELSPIEASIIKDCDSGLLYKMPPSLTYQANEIYKAFGLENKFSIQQLSEHDITLEDFKKQ